MFRARLPTSAQKYDRPYFSEPLVFGSISVRVGDADGDRAGGEALLLHGGLDLAQQLDGGAVGAWGVLGRRHEQRGRERAGRVAVISDNYFCRPARIVDVDQGSSTRASCVDVPRGLVPLPIATVCEPVTGRPPVRHDAEERKNPRWRGRRSNSTPSVGTAPRLGGGMGSAREGLRPRRRRWGETAISVLTGPFRRPPREAHSRVALCRGAPCSASWAGTPRPTRPKTPSETLPM